MTLIRFILIFIVFYLLVRSFVRYFQEDNTSVNENQHDRMNGKKEKGVSKEVGEYIDYEEVD